MAKKQSTTKNITLIRLKGTPFKTAASMKAHEDQILKEEWETVERARIRRELFKKESNQIILAPFFKGFNAKFVGNEGNHENLVKVYLTDDDGVQVDIDNQLKNIDIDRSMESLIKSLVEGFMGGYLTALGLKDETLFRGTSSKMLKK